MTDPLPEDQRLQEISPKAFEHPADRAATAALQSIPMLDVVVRKLIEFGYERALRQILLAGSLKLGSEQMPEIWASHRAACARLDLHEVPDLYLTQFPITNAAAIGADRPVVLLNSRTGEVLDAAELRTVLGPEADHQRDGGRVAAADGGAELGHGQLPRGAGAADGARPRGRARAV